MSLPILTQSEFYNQIKNYFVANQRRVTDMNSGSSLDTQMNAFATQLNQVMVKSAGGFKNQFEQIPYQMFDFQRKTESFASGTAVFSRQDADPVQVDIPSGTIISTSSGLLYTTQSLVSILSGNLSSSAVNIIANEAGVGYNVLSGVITVINSTVPGVNSVTNNTAATGGTDKESDSNYFSRFTIYILGLAKSNRYGIFTAATGVDTVQSAYVEDHFPPESNLYNFTVYVDDGSGSVPQAVLDEIYLEIYGNDTSEYQGYAAAGINFRVLTASLVPITIAYSIEIDPVSADPDTVTDNLETTITNYINSLWVGSDVVRSELIRLIKSADGVLDVPTITLNGTTSNITALASQVARVSVITPTVL